MWDRHMGQWHLMETKGSGLGPKAGPDLRRLYKPFPEAKCFCSCYQPPVCHRICYEIWKLLLRASYLVSILHYSLLFHFKKVSLHLICCSLFAISLSSCCILRWLTPLQKGFHSSKCYFAVEQILRKRIIPNPWCWRLKITLTSNLFSFGFLRQNNFSADFYEGIFDSVVDSTFSKAFSHGPNDI